MATKDSSEATGRSIDDLIDAARQEGRLAELPHDQSDAAEFGAGVWVPAAGATEAMLGLADHSKTTDEPGKLGTARTEAARTAAIVERGVGEVRRRTAESFGASQRMLVLRRAVGTSWHRRVRIEHTWVLIALIAVAVGAEAVFAGKAAEAVGLYDWTRYLFGIGAAIAYLGLGAYIGRVLLGAAEVRPTRSSGTTAADGADAVTEADPVIPGRQGLTRMGVMVLLGALGIWLIGTTGLTILRESYAEQEARAQQREQAEDLAGLSGAAADATGDEAAATADDEDLARNPWRDGLAMWCVAALIGAGLALLEAVRSDPVISEWHDSRERVEGSLRHLTHNTKHLLEADIVRQHAIEEVRNHADALAHRTEGHRLLAAAQELAYRQEVAYRLSATGQTDTDTDTGSTSEVETGPSVHAVDGHGREIQHLVDRARYLDYQVVMAEHHAALVQALAEMSIGLEGSVVPSTVATTDDPATAMSEKVATYLTTDPPYRFVDLTEADAQAAVDELRQRAAANGSARTEAPGDEVTQPAGR